MWCRFLVFSATRCNKPLRRHTDLLIINFKICKLRYIVRWERGYGLEWFTLYNWVKGKLSKRFEESEWCLTSSHIKISSTMASYAMEMITQSEPTVIVGGPTQMVAPVQVVTQSVVVHPIKAYEYETCWSKCGCCGLDRDTTTFSDGFLMIRHFFGCCGCHGRDEHIIKTSEVEKVSVYVPRCCQCMWFVSPFSLFPIIFLSCLYII